MELLRKIDAQPRFIELSFPKGIRVKGTDRRWLNFPSWLTNNFQIPNKIHPLQIATPGRSNEEYMQRILAIFMNLQRTTQIDLLPRGLTLIQDIEQLILLFRNSMAYIAESHRYAVQELIALHPCPGSVYLGLDRGHICHVLIGNKEPFKPAGWLSMPEAENYFGLPVDRSGADIQPGKIRLAGDISTPAKWGTHSKCPECYERRDEAYKLLLLWNEKVKKYREKRWKKIEKERKREKATLT